MQVRWLPVSQSDLRRLYDFLKEVNPRAASVRTRAVGAVVRKLPELPRAGHRLDDYDPREVRAIFIAGCEIRYEIAGDIIIILRIWHQREER